MFKLKKMNINRFNINHIIIKNDKFDIDNVKCTINNKTIQRTFIIIEYETQYINMDGIYLETPILSLFNSCVLVNNCKHKYLFDIPLLDNDKFNNIFSNIDRKIKKIASKTNIASKYINSIKENIIKIDNDNYEYKYITAKLNCNECTITLDNKTYNGDLKELDYSKIEMQFILCCHGLCKTDKYFSLSWKILKLNMKTIILDLNNYKNILFKQISKKIKNKETQKKEFYLNNTINIDSINNVKDINDIDNDIDNDINNDNVENERIYIPNFELELENIEY